jgi:hypothetical protein
MREKRSEGLLLPATANAEEARVVIAPAVTTENELIPANATQCKNANT